MKRIFFILLLLFGGYIHAQTRTDSIHVVNYDIHLSVVDFESETIDGYVDMHVLIKMNNLPYIDLDLASLLSVDSVLLDGVFVDSFTHQGNLLRIMLTNTYSKQDTIALRVYYGGIPENDGQWGGFFFKGEYAYTINCSFEKIPHNYGRAWYPCMDIFTDKSIYSFNIRTRNNKKAICNGLLVDSLLLSDNTIIWKWELKDPIPTYLAAFAVGDYEVYRDIFQSISGDSIPIEIYAPSSHIDNVATSFVNLKTIAQYYEGRFGPYPRERIGYVLVGLPGGAMEHSTNIAYPFHYVNGTLLYESVYAHELSHEWFGNLITCEKAEEMWINEGFATYCALLINEILYRDDNPDIDGYKTSIRDLHRSVLTETHLRDREYYALNNVPLEVTYGSTSYDKGGLVIHVLRNYLGDSLFFEGIRSVLTNYAFKNIHSKALFDHLSQVTNVDLTDFYEAYINQPGFFHFSIDSICKLTGINQYKVYVRQRKHFAPDFANSNRIDLTFFDRKGNRHTVEHFQFSGEYGEGNISIPFEPDFGIVDFHEKLSDAVLDYNLYLTKQGNIECELASIQVRVTDIKDTAFMRIEYNMVKPDEPKTNNPLIYRMSDNHYWRVEYTGNLAAELLIMYNSLYSSSIDYQLMQGYEINNLKLLYRRNPTEDWQVISCTRQGTAGRGYFKTSLLSGEYTLAVGDPSLSVNKDEESDILIYPNPTSGMISLFIPDRQITHFSLLDMQGKIILTRKVDAELMQINMSAYASEAYTFRFYRNKKQIDKKIKVIK
ncbi:MAG: T9SS type A sorting domain-containing protein [Bacteroidales bacterium]|jgi:aminopeptidase N|nr:T9SS type A sorting domain-containing protein [Bacteroidales bacterium]